MDGRAGERFRDVALSRDIDGGSNMRINWWLLRASWDMSAEYLGSLDSEGR